MQKELSHSPRRKLRGIRCHFSRKHTQQMVDLGLDPRYFEAQLYAWERKRVQSSRAASWSWGHRPGSKEDRAGERDFGVTEAKDIPWPWREKRAWTPWKSCHLLGIYCLPLSFQYSKLLLKCKCIKVTFLLKTCPWLLTALRIIVSTTVQPTRPCLILTRPSSHY